MNRGSGLGAVFFDTHGLLAVMNTRDEHHQLAVATVERLVQEKTPVWTSDWVLTEFLSFGLRRQVRRAAIETVLDLQVSRATTIIPAARRTWESAFRLFQTRPDKSWSLVDCTTIAICRERGINRVFTHDHHFAQAGLEILLP